MVLSGVDDPGNRLVVDAGIRCNAVERHPRRLRREDRRDHCRRLRGRPRIDEGLCECGVVRLRTRMPIGCGCGQQCGVHGCGFRTRCDPIRTHCAWSRRCGNRCGCRRRTGFHFCGCGCGHSAGAPCRFVPKRDQHQGAHSHCGVDEGGENPCPCGWCARLDDQVAQNAEAERECACTDDGNSGDSPAVNPAGCTRTDGESDAVDDGRNLGQGRRSKSRPRGRGYCAVLSALAEGKVSIPVSLSR